MTPTSTTTTLTMPATAATTTITTAFTDHVAFINTAASDAAQLTMSTKCLETVTSNSNCDLVNINVDLTTTLTTLGETNEHPASTAPTCGVKYTNADLTTTTTSNNNNNNNSITSFEAAELATAATHLHCPDAAASKCGLEFTDISYILRKIEAELDKPYKEWRAAMENHGRLKVKSTAEQLEAKRKEREKKLQLYNAATSKIFSKKKNGELDEELLAVSGEVLAVNPDFYTLWNYRKETFLELQKTKSKEELQKMFQSELYFLESCLKINPKSYGTWHHRCFVMDTMPEPDWNRELELCSQFLKYDERNFHCWDYRRFVVQRAKISPEAEMEFSMSKISNNFSNYSSWHYRSKLLPVIYPDPSQPMGVQEEVLLKEYELVQNGFFTDPDDQSNWFYHRWLMGRGEQKQAMNCFIVSRSDKSAIISLARHIKVGRNTELILECNGCRLENVTWQNVKRNPFYSTMWTADNVCIPENQDCDIKAVLLENGTEVCSLSLHLAAGDDRKSAGAINKSGCSRFSQELSAVKSETLQQELESVSQLMELETDNKWAVLTVVLLMKALDPIKHESEIMKNLEKLEALDFKRMNYYKDLRSKFIIENVIDESSTSASPTLSLSGRDLTKLYHPELLLLVTTLDLSDNHLTELKEFSYLQSLKELRLCGNNIDSCEGLQHMPKLEKLLLSNNRLSSPECFQSLQSCPSLKVLDISGNPVCDSDVSIEGIKELLPGVEIIIKSSS